MTLSEYSIFRIRAILNSIKKHVIFNLPELINLAVKRVLRVHKYPPDDEPRATEVVLEQAELHASELV